MRSAAVRTKRQRNNNRSLVHDSVDHPRLRSSSLPHGPDLGAQRASPFRPEPHLKKPFISLSVLASGISHYWIEDPFQKVRVAMKTKTTLLIATLRPFSRVTPLCF